MLKTEEQKKRRFRVADQLYFMDFLFLLHRGLVFISGYSSISPAVKVTLTNPFRLVCVQNSKIGPGDRYFRPLMVWKASGGQVALISVNPAFGDLN